MGDGEEVEGEEEKGSRTRREGGLEHDLKRDGMRKGDLDARGYKSQPATAFRDLTGR